MALLGARSPVCDLYLSVYKILGMSSKSLHWCGLSKFKHTNAYRYGSDGFRDDLCSVSACRLIDTLSSVEKALRDSLNGIAALLTHIRRSLRTNRTIKAHFGGSDIQVYVDFQLYSR